MAMPMPLAQPRRPQQPMEPEPIQNPAATPAEPERGQYQAMPGSVVGLLGFLVDRYGALAFGLIAFVVVIGTIVAAYKAIGPDVQAMRDISKNNVETAGLQLQVSSQLREMLTESKGAQDIMAKSVDRIERAAERVERAVEKRP